ncbi:MAG: SAM-dependent methyltransferase [Janthinobacterium lividum]
MNLIAATIRAAERLPLSDGLTLSGIDFLVGRTARKLNAAPAQADADFVTAMQAFPVAIHTDDANAQHYEVPADFFQAMLGPRRKYSCCYFDAANSTLAQAEEAALAASCEHAQLADGQRILELGCGWGSLTLWMAEHYPRAHITAVSNSASQRAYIESRLAAGGYRNVRVVTEDMNRFATDPQSAPFDRVVSIEMFEHMANWDTLLQRVRAWVAPHAKLFLHVFSHRAAPYRFDHRDPTDWIAQHFFTGGLMPSHRMIEQFSNVFQLEQQWRWDGTHYARTAQAWLDNFDEHDDSVERILAEVYGADAGLWRRRWRLFLLSTIGLFGHRHGSEWGVSHYLLSPTAPF